MNIHKNARLTLIRRSELVGDMSRHGLTAELAARAYGVTPPTARKWFGRFLAEGAAGLRDRSSRPAVSPRATSPAKALAIVELRKRRLTHARIAASLGVSQSTVGRVLARAGLSRLSDLEPKEPVKRYELEAPGQMLHIDTKKLGRILVPGHRVTKVRGQAYKGKAGWEYLFVAVDDHARIAFTEVYANEKKESADQFLRNAILYFNSLGIHVKQVLTDNGPAFRSKIFNRSCQERGVRHRYTRFYRPQTNGKAERFIQSALREWAYGWTFQTSEERTSVLRDWLHHYNWHRPHQGIGGIAPMSRLRHSRNNLLTIHS
jgi:transposase InsO family protein